MYSTCVDFLFKSLFFNSPSLRWQKLNKFPLLNHNHGRDGEVHRVQEVYLNLTFTFPFKIISFNYICFESVLNFSIIYLSASFIFSAVLALISPFRTGPGEIIARKSLFVVVTMTWVKCLNPTFLSGERVEALNHQVSSKGHQSLRSIQLPEVFWRSRRECYHNDRCGY